MIPLEQIDAAIKGQPSYRKAQIYRALFTNTCSSWREATDLPADLRAQLTQSAPLAIDSRFFESEDERSIKALTRLADGNYTETVLMRAGSRNTVCVSTQVGCAMGCVFCASGQNGFTRNLTFEEIVGQVLLFARKLKAEDRVVTNVVFMGIGEPLLNYDNLIAAIRFMNRKDTLDLGVRRFSISTSGISRGIKKLAVEDSLAVNLAISLHSAINEKRAKLMPVDQRTRTGLLAANLKEYFAKTKRKIMIEYVLLEMNTGREDALALRDFINEMGAAYVVNLIPLNENDGSNHKSPDRRDLYDFKELLTELKINHVQRHSFGTDIAAACGQLAGRTDASPARTRNAR